MTIPLTLYIHIPWCQRKCPYCDFNSHAVRNSLPIQEYGDALLQDLSEQSDALQGRPIQSIFIGGGTPSLMPGEFYHTLLNKLDQSLKFSDSIEITLEANPGSAEQQRFREYHAAGINRLSLGAQSFQDQKLLSLGRIHRSEHALSAFAMAREAGFENINIDLMFGLPKQTVQEGLADLQQAIALKPEHLSWYQLTLEPNTYFYRHPPPLPADDLIWDLQEQGQRLLSDHGYLQYEVSAYSHINKRCQHNLNYWRFGDYVGIGAGAHGKWTELNTGTVTRRCNIKHPQDYLNPQKNFAIETKTVSPQDLVFEFMLNALRLQEPVSLNLFKERTGLDRKILSSMITLAEKKELLQLNNECLNVTELGKRFLNDLVEIFIAASTTPLDHPIDALQHAPTQTTSRSTD